MKIDETDIRTYSAKQLTVDYTLPSTAVSVDMFDGALIPSEGETHASFGRDGGRSVQRQDKRRGAALCQ